MAGLLIHYHPPGSNLHLRPIPRTCSLCGLPFCGSMLAHWARSLDEIPGVDLPHAPLGETPDALPELVR